MSCGGWRASARVIRRPTTQEKEMQKYRKDLDAISRLSPEQYRVTQQSATEYLGSGEHLYNSEPGI
jgi:peptide methionine sulfoxide reductase MsrB